MQKSLRHRNAQRKSGRAEPGGDTPCHYMSKRNPAVRHLPDRRAQAVKVGPTSARLRTSTEAAIAGE